MLFSSVSFLYYFLPILLIGYLILPTKWKNPLLLLFSMFFYFYGENLYIWILVFSSVVDYTHGIGIEKYRGTWITKALLTSSVMINVGLLTTFKYSDFFVQNLNDLLLKDNPLALPGLALPLGISFYTFQTMSYTIDVYRGNVKAQRNFIDFATYVTMFPQLVAGPIVRYSDVADQIEERKRMGRMDRDTFFAQFGLGVERFAMGVGKKVIIANALGELAKTLYASQEPSVVLYWVAMAAFSLQIYFDFAGYSDMAIGLGHMIGFKFPENFDHPFISQSITEFWRRWHMTLGGWFRDYVYIPLGGSRGSLLKQIRNIFIVWFLTGFWHGASWNFVLWGLYFGVLLTLEKMVWGKAVKNAPRVVRHIYTLFLLSFSFVIFDTVDLSLLPIRIGGMLGLTDVPFLNGFTLYYLKSYGLLLLISVLAATPLPAELYRKLRARLGKRGEGQATGTWLEVLDGLEVVAMAAMLIVCTAYIVDSSFNPFLYFRF
ncbi:MAG: MBOAT family protein [Firmicutes bacterium]|nr:MBOAT family protein [Bacillota bacterium]